MSQPEVRELEHYRLCWTRRLSDDLITLWLGHDVCARPQIEGWEVPPSLAQLQAAALAHDAECTGEADPS